MVGPLGALLCEGRHRHIRTYMHKYTHTHKQVSHLESGFTLDSQLRFCLPAYKMGAVTALTRHSPGTQLTTTCMVAEALVWHMELSSCPLGLFLQVALELLRPVT